VAWAAQWLPGNVRRLSLESLLARYAPARAWTCYRGLPHEVVAAAVRNWLRRPWRMRDRRCLRQGLLLMYFLRRAGYRPTLHFGVYPTRVPRADAHCWVTLDGQAVSDPPNAPYTLVLQYSGETPVQPALAQAGCRAA
jgi:hypothetical protein